MAFCSYADGSAIHSVTAVDNIFLMEYMPGAPADFVKVYLYALLLCSQPELCSDAEQMAGALHTDVNTVLNAFRYWEREGLAVQISEEPPEFRLISLHCANLSSHDDLDDPVYQNRSYNRELQSLMPSLILDGHELRIAADWLDVLGLSREAVLYMVKLEVDRRGGKLPTVRTLFNHLNETALEWANAGVTDLSSAEEHVALTGAHKSVADRVLRQFGQKRSPSVDEIRLVCKWCEEWKLTADEIISGCADTVKGTSPSFAYLDKILEGRVNGEDDVLRQQLKTLNLHLGVSTRPTPAQGEMLKHFLDMGFEFAAVEQAAIWCGENNRRSFEDIDKKLEVWKKAGAFTVAEIEEERKIQKQFSAIVSQIFEKAAVDRKILSSDIQFAKVWTALMPLETVLYAAELSQGSENPIKYINKLVQTWSASGITTVEKAKQAAPKAIKVADSHRNYDERSVSDNEFENNYYADIMNRKRKGE